MLFQIKGISQFSLKATSALFCCDRSHMLLKQCAFKYAPGVYLTQNITLDLLSMLLDHMVPKSHESNLLCLHNIKFFGI